MLIVIAISIDIPVVLNRKTKDPSLNPRPLIVMGIMLTSQTTGSSIRKYKNEVEQPIASEIRYVEIILKNWYIIDSTKAFNSTAGDLLYAITFLITFTGDLNFVKMIEGRIFSQYCSVFSLKKSSEIKNPAPKEIKINVIKLFVITLNPNNEAKITEKNDKYISASIPRALSTRIELIASSFPPLYL